MRNLSKPKRIVAIAVIFAVLVLPAYLAFNDQGVQDTFYSLGTQIASTAPDEAPTDDAQISGSIILDAEAPEINLLYEAEDLLPMRTPKPGEFSQNGNTGSGDVIGDAIRIVPSPTPEPTPTPKWTPEHPATDGEILYEGLTEDDSVNVLIMGNDRTAFLFDTIGVVSVSAKKKSIKLIMFPRDLHIGYSPEVLANIDKIRHTKLPGEYKINNTYNVARNTEKYDSNTYNDGRFGEHSYDFLAQVVYEKFDIYIDDFVRINTFGLVKLVDQFGGVRVYVPIYMRYRDPDQNLNINISKGTQVLNGAQAEGFVRFRQGLDSKGNLTVTADRTQNQIAFMKAFFEQHAKLSNIDKIPAVMSVIKNNVTFSIGADDIFLKYVDVLTSIVKESYEMESVQFDTYTKRINGALEHFIKGVKKAE